MRKSTEIKSAVKWLIVIVAVIAAGLSLWLTIRKLTGEIDSLAGCGAGSGCANVLGSKWSMVFGVVPVSVFSLCCYLGVLASLWMRGEKVRWFRMLAAWVFLGAAAWFTLLQMFVMHTFCPYCMTIHGLGVVLGILILIAEIKVPGALGRVPSSLIVAVVLVMGLAAVQYFGPEPETHRVDDGVGVRIVKIDDIHSQGSGRLVSFLNGKISYRVEVLPHIGAPDAEHVVVKYFDYTCEACRDMHDNLERIITKYPGKLVVIVLPVPLNSDCNPHLPNGVKDHANACELARLALKVWHADRTKFPEFHKWLFDYNELPVEAAEAMAYSMVGEEKMAKIDEAWVDKVLRQDMADYREFVKKTPVMPKLLVKDSIIQGKVKDGETLEQLLKNQLGLK